MARSAKSPCKHSGCRALVQIVGYCEQHKTNDKNDYDSRRGSSTQRGYNYKWQQARKRFLSQYPLCVICEKDNRTTVATVVDHITPHKGDKRLFWSLDNWQPLCKPHHDHKTATEDSDFANGWGG